MSFFQVLALKIFIAISGIIALIGGVSSPSVASDVSLASETYLAEQEVVVPETADAPAPVIHGDLIPTGLKEEKKPAPVGKVVAPAEVAPKAEVAATKPAPAPALNLNKEFAFDPAWSNTVVNLFCMDRYGGYSYSGGGSGVIIDPRGIILTSAHVVWPYFIFSEWPNPSLYQCTVRLGTPAKPMYTARLLYVPPQFAKTNFDLLYDYQREDKYVYGEHDYALLMITGRTDPSEKLPATFPYLPVYTGPVLGEGSFIFDVGYPAGYLGGMTMQTSLGQAASPTRIYQRRSIKGTTDINLFSYLGDIAGQAGSSGGPVIKAGGEVAGLNAFVDDFASNTHEQILIALSTNYINTRLKEDTGYSLSEFLALGDFKTRSDAFMAGQAAKYQRLYVDAWRKNQDIIVPGVTY